MRAKNAALALAAEGGELDLLSIAGGIGTRN
jgi:hypothetical protein